jgi:hypothetical protein
MQRLLSPSLSLSSLLPLSRGARPRRHHAKQAIIPGLFINNNNNNNFGAQQREQRRRRLLHVVPSSSSQQQQIKLNSKLQQQQQQQQQNRYMMVSTSDAGNTTDNNNKGDDNNKNDEEGTTTTSSHYENHSKEESYEDAYFYEPGEYMEHLINLCRDRLQIQIPIAQEKADQKQTRKRKSPEEKPDQISIRKRCILDIGGGTGNFAKELIHQNDNSRIVVIDPFLIGDNNNTDNYIDYSNPGSDIVSFIKAPAEDFLISQSSDDWRTTIINYKYDGYDQILLKEVIHHFHKKDRVGIFRGMKDGLRKQSNSKSTRNKLSRKSKSTTTTDLQSQSQSQSYPSILIITRPQIEIDYPLWSDAKEVWKQNQPSIEEIQQDLMEAGYTNVKWTVESYPCDITLNRWIEMIRSRFWSTFSNFSDLELEDACNEITAKAKKAKTINGNDNDDNDSDDNDSILRFEDRLIFLTAS